MRVIPFTSLFLLIINLTNAQRSEIDSLKHELTVVKEDTIRIKILNRLGTIYSSFNSDTGLAYSKQGLELAKKINFREGEGTALNNIGLIYYSHDQIFEALDCFRQYLDISISLHNDQQTSFAYNNIGLVHNRAGNPDKALENYLLALKFREITNDKTQNRASLFNIANYYWKHLGDLDKALDYYLKIFRIVEEHPDFFICYQIGLVYLEKGDYTNALFFFKKTFTTNLKPLQAAYVYKALGDLYTAKAKYDSALNNYTEALTIVERSEEKASTIEFETLMSLGKLHYKSGDYQTAHQYFKKVEMSKTEKKVNNQMLDLYQNMALVYEKNGDYTSAYKYQVELTKIKDTLSKNKIDKALSDLQINLKIQSKQDSVYSEKNKEIQKLNFDRISSQNQFKIYSLIGGLTVLLILAAFLYRSNRNKQKAKTKIEQAYSELKSTQAQLIQREKMASLGELTAGIAHEIQNPLNFVNNFSEVSNEMIDEMHLEIDKGNTLEAKQIATDIRQNLEKINHHGKRADSIVKGMLEHSRTSTGKKEPTDINALTTEYFNLAYHGMRAKDKSFNVNMKTEFDNTIGEINVVVQDIGRVILNLINNAFYAVNEKQKQNREGYEPIVSVSTKKTNNKIEIKVADNGSGIPPKIVDKIFQPFFTTKPTGQGTGLGLSLSYDIVKAHAGELKVETKETMGSEFTIILPA